MIFASAGHASARHNSEDALTIKGMHELAEHYLPYWQLCFIICKAGAVSFPATELVL